MAGLSAGWSRHLGTYESVDLDRLEGHILECVRHVVVGREVCTGVGRGNRVGRRWCRRAK